MMRRPNRGMQENKNQLDNPEVSHIDTHHGLESIGFTLGPHFWILADDAELFIEQSSYSGPAGFLTC